MNWTIGLAGIYLVAICWWISHWKRFRPADMSAFILILFFLSRVAMAVFYGWIHQRYYPGFNDSWKSFHQAVTLASWWHRNPQGFWQYVHIRLNYLLYRDFLGVHHTFWQSSGNYVMIVLQMIFNLFSGSSYYLNCLFFSLLTLPGWLRFMQLYRAVAHMPVRATWIWFHLPGVWFWFSGMHKDALVLMCLSLLGYHTHRLLQHLFSDKAGVRLPVGDSVWIVFSWIGVLLLKNFLVLLLLPAWLAWITSVFLKTGKFRLPRVANRLTRSAEGGLFIFCLVGWLLVGMLMSRGFQLHPLQIIIERQQAFYRVGLELGAHSLLSPIPLMPDWLSLLKALPQAVWRVLSLPDPSHRHALLQLSVQLNNVIFLLLLMAAIWSASVRKIHQVHPWLLFSYWLALSYLLLIGYTVCITGAMVRYRALAEFFLAAPGVDMLYKKCIKKNNI